MADLAEITVGDLDHWLDTLEKPSCAFRQQSESLSGTTSALIADYLPEFLGSDLSDLDLLTLDAASPDPMPSLNMICSSLGIALEPLSEVAMEYPDIKQDYDTPVQAASWPQCENTVPATQGAAQGSCDVSADIFTPDDCFLSAPYVPLPAQDAFSPAPPLGNVPFALLSTLPPTNMPTLLPLSVRMSMLRLRLRGRGSRRSIKLAALQHFYTERSEHLEAQRFFQLTQAGATAWHMEQTNHYFDLQHHALIDSMEAYLRQHQSQSRKRPAPENLLEPPCKQLHLSTALSSPPTSVMSPMLPSDVDHPASPLSVASLPPTVKSRPPPLSKHSVNLMDSWYLNHQEHPYPSTELIHQMAEEGGITSEQVKKWFSNRRMRCRNTKSWKEIRQRRSRETPNIMNEVFLNSELRG